MKSKGDSLRDERRFIGKVKAIHFWYIYEALPNLYYFYIFLVFLYFVYMIFIKFAVGLSVLCP